MDEGKGSAVNVEVFLNGQEESVVHLYYRVPAIGESVLFDEWECKVEEVIHLQEGGECAAHVRVAKVRFTGEVENPGPEVEVVEVKSRWGRDDRHKGPKVWW